MAVTVQQGLRWRSRAAWTSVVIVVLGTLTMAEEDDGREVRPKTPQVPKDYETMETWMPGHEVSTTVGAEGPDFSAYVYLEVPFDDAYDKRVIFATYVQKVPGSCPYPTACDGQRGGDEFDMIETGFVGFNSTWPVNDNKNCWHCGGSDCWSGGQPGCHYPGGTRCETGDKLHCNGWTVKAQKPQDCTWSDGQGSITFCTQVTELDARYQDNTKFSANGFLGGQTGKKWLYKCGAGTMVENDQDAYAVVTPDQQKWGNRWIKLDLKLVRNQAWYTWSFFQPGHVSNTSVKIAGIQSLMLEHTDASWNTFNGDPFKWVFSIWEYHFKSSRAKVDIFGGMRKLHYKVLDAAESTGMSSRRAVDEKFKVGVDVPWQPRRTPKAVIGAAAAVGALASPLALAAAYRSWRVGHAPSPESEQEPLALSGAPSLGPV